MEILNKIRLKIALYLLRQKAKSRIRFMRAIDLDQVKSMAIIFKVENPESRKVIANFMQPFIARGVKCHAYGYIAQEDNQHNYISDTLYTFFSKKDLDFAYRPKGGVMDDFIDRDWSLLLVATQDCHFILKWMVTLSNSRFKVGPSGCYSAELDFIVEGNNLTIDLIIKHIKHFLGELKITHNTLA